jgi:hypothetical protein
VRNRNKSDDYLLYFSSISHLDPIIRRSFSLFLGYAWNEPFVWFSTPERITKEPSIDMTLLGVFAVLFLW